ncbi:MAG: ParB/RepB/Spo0J family partition protein [Pirellulaceae bacterium]|nr:ParB/RepB/Spo0J family partition protein [Pirellulaceae bacterium]
MTNKAAVTNEYGMGAASDYDRPHVLPMNAPGVGTSRTALPAVDTTQPLSTMTTLDLDVSLIDANPFQPRRQFNEEEIASLAESIKEHQQLQPVLVRKVGQRYQLISGERRLRATVYAGLTKVRAEVREADDRLVAELAIIENLQRKDLNPIEKALSFRRYLDEHACPQEELARRLKIDRSTIANLMRLLELPPPILEAVQNDKLSAGHARALLPLGEESQQLAMARQIQSEGWSVRQTEHSVTEILAKEDGKSDDKPNRGKRGSARTVTPQIGSLEQELRRSLGTKIEIRQSARGRGKIVVHFNSAEEFERIRDILVPGSRAAA